MPQGGEMGDPGERQEPPRERLPGSPAAVGSGTVQTTTPTPGGTSADPPDPAPQGDPPLLLGSVTAGKKLQNRQTNEGTKDNDPASLLRQATVCHTRLLFHGSGR